MTQINCINISLTFYSNHVVHKLVSDHLHTFLQYDRFKPNWLKSNLCLRYPLCDSVNRGWIQTKEMYVLNTCIRIRSRVWLFEFCIFSRLCFSRKRSFHQKNSLHTREPPPSHSDWCRDVPRLLVCAVLALFCGLRYSWCHLSLYLTQKKSRHGRRIRRVHRRGRPCRDQALK